MVHQRYVVLVFVLGAILAGVSMQSASSSLIVATHYADFRVLGPFTISNVLSVGTGAAVLAGLFRSRTAVSFVDEVVDELHKVTWPSKDETVKASTTVVFTALFTAAMIGLYDFVWNNLAGLFL